MTSIIVKKIEESVNETKELLEKVRDRLGIEATIEVNKECEDNVIISFDRWLSITVFWGVNEIVSINKKEIEQICYGVDICKTHPATYMETEDYEQIDQGTFKKPCLAIRKVLNLYFQNEIDNIFQSIDEEELDIYYTENRWF